MQLLECYMRGWDRVASQLRWLQGCEAPVRQSILGAIALTATVQGLLQNTCLDMHMSCSAAPAIWPHSLNPQL